MCSYVCVVCGKEGGGMLWEEERIISMECYITSGRVRPRYAELLRVGEGGGGGHYEVPAVTRTADHHSICSQQCRLI